MSTFPTNPADCDRTTVYTGECRNFADTEWIRFDSGRRRAPDARDGNTWLIDVAHGSFWMSDDQVRNLVRLVPERGEEDRMEARLDAEAAGAEMHDAYAARDDAFVSLRYAEDDRDAALARAEQAERERDDEKSRSEFFAKRADEARRERDEALRKKGEMVDRAVRAERERDAAVARADNLDKKLAKVMSDYQDVEDERDAAVARAEAHAKGATRSNLDRDTAYEELADMTRERDEWKARAEKAEARTAAAVTRADVERLVHRYIDGGFDELHASRVKSTTDAFMALLSGDDPAVHVVRESDLPEVGRTDDGWTDGTRHGWEGTSETAMECVETHLEWARFYAAAARAIEAEAAVDPVEAKAREEADRRYSGDPNHAFIEGAVWAARHVLEREASSDE